MRAAGTLSGNAYTENSHPQSPAFDASGSTQVPGPIERGVPTDFAAVNPDRPKRFSDRKALSAGVVPTPLNRRSPATSPCTAGATARSLLHAPAATTTPAASTRTCDVHWVGRTSECGGG